MSQAALTLLQSIADSSGGVVTITLDGEAVVLGAGSAAIGKLAANSGVDIGDVDILTMPDQTIGATTIDDYETVAASQTAQALGATGATGDFLSGVLVVPGTTSPGAVSIKDGAGGAITIFTGGASSVSTLHPFFVPINAKSTAGAWQVTTGANVTAIGVGKFT